MSRKEKNLVTVTDLEEGFGDSGTMIDDANGVIKGVAILRANKVSQNKTLYTPKAVAEAAGRYEGARMFINHPADKNANRAVEDFGGIYKNLRIDGDVLRGDLHLSESKRPMIMSIAKLRPAGVGLSIKDRGFGSQKEGVFVVEGFMPEAKYSIDFVIEPSVNKDLFESKTGGDDMDYKEITADGLRKERPELVEAFLTEGKSGMLKDLEEAKAKGEKAETVELRANKLIALIEAEFADKEVREEVRKMIDPENVTLDAAKAIIKGQKALIEAILKKSANADPAIKGVGQRKADELEEGAKDKKAPSADDVASAFKS